MGTIESKQRTYKDGEVVIVYRRNKVGTRAFDKLYGKIVAEGDKRVTVSVLDGKQELTVGKINVERPRRGPGFRKSPVI